MKHHLSILAVLFFALTFAPIQAQEAGESKPNPQKKLKAEQYKRVHQYALRMLENEKPEKAKETLEACLKDYPDDLESHYMMCLYYAQQNDIPTAIEWLKKGVVKGLPPGRIIAGPRELIAPIKDDPTFQAILQGMAHQPIHGPIVGNVTDEQAMVWIRTVNPCDVRLRVSTHPDMHDPIISEPAQSTDASDFTAKPLVRGLAASTKYHYQLEIDGELSPHSPTNLFFTTFRAKGTPGKLNLAFGGGAGFVPPNEKMWGTIRSEFPDLLLLLGDNVYIDDPKSVMQQHYTYYRRQSRQEFQVLTATTPTFTIWDDHDFGTNDCWGGPEIKKPDWKYNDVWPIFRQNWPNPGFGGGESQPGCWYHFSAGDVDFVMLDCRYYRTAPKSENPSMLGSAQMKWLKETLPTLKGKFKVICSSVPWEYRTKGDSNDTWNGYRSERDEIFDFLNTQKLEGIVLMSADRHRSDAWKIDNPEGYDFYEFNSSRLTNQHVHPEMKQAIFSYNKKQSYGQVTFDTSLDDPTATYAVINIDGEKVHELTVKLSELRAL